MINFPLLLLVLFLFLFFFIKAQAFPVGGLEDNKDEREIELGGQTTASAGMKLG